MTKVKLELYFQNFGLTQLSCYVNLSILSTKENYSSITWDADKSEKWKISIQVVSFLKFYRKDEKSGHI